jgi:23S rRNA maturation mini-RNase III
MNEPEKIDPRELSPLALAFVGDSVLELLVRQRLVEHHRLSAGKLNAEKVKYVSARAQFREEQLEKIRRNTEAIMKITEANDERKKLTGQQPVQKSNKNP